LIQQIEVIKTLEVPALEEVQAKLKSGEDLQTLAAEYSENLARKMMAVTRLMFEKRHDR